MKRRAQGDMAIRTAERIMASLPRFLTDKLRLVVNQEKSRVVASEEFEFLGFAFRKSRATINVAPKSIDRFKRRKQQGLVSMKTLWAELASLRRTA